MDFLGRWFALLMLLMCIVQLCECLKFPSWLTKTEEEKAEERRFKAAKTAYKRLFVKSDKLSREDILEGIKTLDHYTDQFKFDLDIDDLMNIREAELELCDDREYVLKLENLVRVTKRRHRALHEWVNDALEKQRELCRNDERSSNKLEQFKTEHADQWKLIEDFNFFASLHGARMYDWKDDLIDNTPQMNQAMKEMINDRVLRGSNGDQRDLSPSNVAQNLREACTNFANSLGSAFLINKSDPKIKEDEEQLKWVRYLIVCQQVKRTDFVHRGARIAFKDV